MCQIPHTYPKFARMMYMHTLGLRVSFDTIPRTNEMLPCSLALAAYDSPNFPPLGELGVTMRYRRDITLAPPRGPFRVHTKMDSRVVSW